MAEVEPRPAVGPAPYVDTFQRPGHPAASLHSAGPEPPAMVRPSREPGRDNGAYCCGRPSHPGDSSGAGRALPAQAKDPAAQAGATTAPPHARRRCPPGLLPLSVRPCVCRNARGVAAYSGRPELVLRSSDPQEERRSCAFMPLAPGTCHPWDSATLLGACVAAFSSGAGAGPPCHASSSAVAWPALSRRLSVSLPNRPDSFCAPSPAPASSCHLKP